MSDASLGSNRLSRSQRCAVIPADPPAVRSFVEDHNNGIDKVIPQSVMQRAAGFAIFTVIKAGFVLSARAGSGVVIARLPEGGA